MKTRRCVECRKPLPKGDPAYRCWTCRRWPVLNPPAVRLPYKADAFGVELETLRETPEEAEAERLRRVEIYAAQYAASGVIDYLAAPAKKEAW